MKEKIDSFEKQYVAISKPKFRLLDDEETQETCIQLFFKDGKSYYCLKYERDLDTNVSPEEDKTFEVLLVHGFDCVELYRLGIDNKWTEI